MHLIVHNIDFLESLLDLRVVTINLGQVLIHLDEFSIVLVNSGFRLFVTVGTIDLKLLQSLGQLLVILLEGIYLGLAG